MRKQKRYWLRVGLTLAVLHAVIFLAYIFAFWPEIQQDFQTLIPLNLLDIVAALVFSWGVKVIQSILVYVVDYNSTHFFDYWSIMTRVAVLFVLGSLQWFGIGSYLGWFYNQDVRKSLTKRILGSLIGRNG